MFEAEWVDGLNVHLVCVYICTYSKSEEMMQYNRTDCREQKRILSLLVFCLLTFCFNKVLSHWFFFGSNS